MRFDKNQYIIGTTRAKQLICDGELSILVKAKRHRAVSFRGIRPVGTAKALLQKVIFESAGIIKVRREIVLGTVASITGLACKEGYAVAAANVGSSIEVCAALEAASALKAPLILDVLQQNLTSQPREFCSWVIAVCRQANVPVALNIDDGKTFAGAISAITYGATSIMSHRAQSDFEENIVQTRRIVDIARALGVSVEAAVDLNGEFDEGKLKRFIAETGADCTAFGIRRSASDNTPYLDLELLTAVKKTLGSYPLVLHGTLGLPQEQIASACRMGISKVNFSKELKAASLKYVEDHAGEDTPANLIKAGFRDKLMELIRLCGSDGRILLP